ncbi:MAG: polysaccharide biosynthesis C-terminal domain-containing protein [Ktedonobacterales bacterium]|nr:polysaccharide biosynthesis C-terminal domain-containing protein [Ktedonobacterales bacterium]
MTASQSEQNGPEPSPSIVSQPISVSVPPGQVQLTGLEVEGITAAPESSGERAPVPPLVTHGGRRGPHQLVARARLALNAKDGYGALVIRLLKSSGVYAIAAMGAPLISLVLTPFLAHQLSRTDYGFFATLVTVITLAGGVTQLGLGSAFFRAYNYDFTAEQDRRAVLSTATVLLILGVVPLELAALFASSFVADVVLGRPDLSQLVLVAAGVILVQNLAVPAFAWLRAEDRALAYALLSLANLSINLIANVVLVGVFRLGIMGALISIGLGFGSVVLVMLPLILFRGGLRFRRDVAWSMLAFGVPQVGGVISFWVLQLSDRYLLLHMVSAAQTASYSVAYSLGSVLSTLVISPFQLAWPTTMYAVAKRGDAARVYMLVFRYLGMVLLFAAFAVSLLSALLLDVLFPTSYHSAALVIPIIALSIAFYGAYLLFVTGVAIRRLTWLATLFTTTAAVVNVGLNLVLIPRFTAMGAAASTLIAYVLMALVAYAVNQRIYPIPFEVTKFFGMALLAVTIFAASYTAAQVLGGWARWPISVTGLVVYAGCLVLFAWRGRSSGSTVA